MNKKKSRKNLFIKIVIRSWFESPQKSYSFLLQTCYRSFLSRGQTKKPTDGQRSNRQITDWRMDRWTDMGACYI